MISMKVCKTDVNKISLHSIILQLQLTLELSQFKEILSVYSDLLVLVANYSFIFENSSSEIQALKANPVSVETALITQDPIRDGLNWYGYCNNNPINNIDENGLETWRSSTLTRDKYDNNYQLQRQYSWEQIQQHFADNPNGIIYRYDTVSYSLGKSNKDFPNMEKPGAELALGLACFSKLAGSKIISLIKNGLKSAIASSAMDTTLQLTNMAKNENQSFNTNELLNTTVGGFVSGFVTGGIASIPGGSPNANIILSNAVGGFSGSMTSQLMFNVQNGNFLFEGMDSAYMYGTAGGLMVGGVNVCFPTILPGNIGQIIKDQIISTSTEQVLEEKMNEKCTETGN